MSEDVEMNMFEKAESIRAMMHIEGMTQKRLAGVLGVSQSFVANKIRLLSLGAEVKKKILEYGISERHARCLLRLPSDEDRLSAIEKIHAMNMNVSRCEILVDTILDEKVQKRVPCSDGEDGIYRFERSLESSLSLLREVGIIARSKREKVGDTVYFSISIG